MNESSNLIIALLIGVPLTLGFVALMYRLQRSHPDEMKNVEAGMGCLELILGFFRR